IAFGSADMGMGRMHARGEEADQGEGSGFGQRISRPQPEPLPQVRQDRRILGERRAVVEAEHRYPSPRVELAISLGALLAPGEIDLARLVFLAALLKYDVRRHGAGARRVVQRQHAVKPHFWPRPNWRRLVESTHHSAAGSAAATFSCNALQPPGAFLRAGL